MNKTSSMKALLAATLVLPLLTCGAMQARKPIATVAPVKAVILAAKADKAGAVDQSQYKMYLDQMWIRITRTWGVVSDEHFTSEPITIVFDMDRNGNVSHVSLEKASGSSVTDKQMMHTIEASSPFPPLPAGAPDKVQVRCKLQHHLGALAVDAQIPAFEGKGASAPIAHDTDKLKELISAARDGSNSSTRLDALEKMKAMGAEAKSAVPALVEIAGKDKNEEIRYAAFEVLQEMGPAAKAAVPDLIKFLGSSEDRKRVNAAETLASIGPDAEEAVPALLEALDDKDSYLQKAASAALRKTGSSNTKKAIAVLVADLHSYISSVPDILAEFPPDDLLPALVTALKDPEQNMRRHAVETLEKLGKAATPVVPELIAALSDPDSEVAEKSIETLSAIGPAAKASVPKLTEMLSSSNSSYRWKAISALGEIGPAAKGALPALQDALSDNDVDLRKQAKDAIRRIQTKEQ